VSPSRRTHATASLSSRTGLRHKLWLLVLLVLVLVLLLPDNTPQGVPLTVHARGHQLVVLAWHRQG
jgi:hypothetical protein